MTFFFYKKKDNDSNKNFMIYIPNTINSSLSGILNVSIITLIFKII